MTLKLAGTQSFPTGGQITVLPGVTSGSGSVLSGTTVFDDHAGRKIRSCRRERVGDDINLAVVDA